MNPANPNVAASVRARVLDVAKAQGVDFNPACQQAARIRTAQLTCSRSFGARFPGKWLTRNRCMGAMSI